MITMDTRSALIMFTAIVSIILVSHVIADAMGINYPTSPSIKWVVSLMTIVALVVNGLVAIGV